MPRKKKIKEIKEIQITTDIHDDQFVVSSLLALKENPGWKIIEKILDENILEQERKILNTLFKKELEFNEEDLEKQIRRVYIDIRGLPEREIARLRGNDAADEDYDPYYKKIK